MQVQFCIATTIVWREKNPRDAEENCLEQKLGKKKLEMQQMAEKVPSAAVMERSDEQI